MTISICMGLKHRYGGYVEPQSGLYGICKLFFLRDSIAIHFPYKCYTTKYWYVSITSVTNCSSSIRFAPIHSSGIITMSYYFRFCIFFHYDEMSPIFIDYPEFLRLQGMVEMPCNEISKNRFVKDIFWLAIHFPYKCCTIKYWYVSITSVINCPSSIRFAPIQF
jgi:hypothetical protein